MNGPRDTVRVLDFRPSAFRQALEDEADPELPRESFEGFPVLPDPQKLRKGTYTPTTSIVRSAVPTYIDLETLFKERVETHLPYVLTTSAWKVPEESDLMIDNEHLYVVTSERVLECLTL